MAFRTRHNAFELGIMDKGKFTPMGIYGIVLGLGASGYNWIGKTMLKRFSNKTFSVFVIVVMIISGLSTIGKQVVKQF